ncbi:MAG: hypothetical protein KDA94_13495 [Acidimicrobiales bacterium]|nr:hypothetical protein [Acidimicrobiales bacterium]
MSIALATIASAAIAAVLWTFSRSMFEAPVLQRRNYRGVDVPVGAGILLVITAIVVEAVLALWRVSGEHLDAHRGERLVFLLVCGLFCLLGVFDDLAAHGDDRGFRGHVTGMLHGRLTTGGLKLVAGGMVAIVGAAALGADSIGALVVGGALVALAANLANLFDRAPGRASKVALVCAAIVLACAAAGERPSLVGMAILAGAAAGLLAFDLREELMSGDAGSNVLGAAVGLGIVATCSVPVQAAVLVLLVALNLASERVSFSRVIDSVAPLRWLDRLGRRSVDA